MSRSPRTDGDAEQSHHRFKRAVEQALLLRGSREFGSLAEYAQFLKDLFGRRNAGRRARLAEEMTVMRELPVRRMESAKRERVKVDSGSLIHVERNAYSVNSRLIGARVEARSYLDHVEVWYGQRKVEDLPRLRGRGKHRIDYRHIIEWLARKPGAFENYRYQEDLFPTSRFRMAYDALRERTPSRSSKEYLKILKLAAEAGEVWPCGHGPAQSPKGRAVPPRQNVPIGSRLEARRSSELSATGKDLFAILWLSCPTRARFINRAKVLSGPTTGARRTYVS